MAVAVAAAVDVAGVGDAVGAVFCSSALVGTVSSSSTTSIPHSFSSAVG